MNVNIARMAPTAKALRGIEAELKRIADCLTVVVRESYNVDLGPKPDTAGEDPVVSYTDEEKDWRREYMAKLRGTEDEEPENE